MYYKIRIFYGQESEKKNLLAIGTLLSHLFVTNQIGVK